MTRKLVLALGIVAALECYGSESAVKGDFSKYEVRTLSTNGYLTEMLMEDAQGLSDKWSSSRFHKEGDVYTTGEYKAKDTVESVSPAILLPEIATSENLYLVLNESYSTERNYDFVTVSVSVDNGKSFKRICKRSGATDFYNEYMDLTPFAGKNIIIKLSLTADAEFEGKGWSIKKVSVIKSNSYTKKAVLKSLSFDVASMVEKVDFLGFEQPDSKVLKYRLYISTMNENGNFVSDLRSSDLEVSMNGVQIDESCFSLEQLDDYSNQAVDIAFLMDNSGSMQDDIDGVAANVREFVTEVGSSMNASAGIYRFGFSGSDCPKEKIMWNPSDFYLNISLGFNDEDENQKLFINKWNTQTSNGSYEPYYSMLYDMVEDQSMNYRKNAQKVIIIIGDETALYDQNATDCSRGGKRYTLEDKEDLQKKLRSSGFQVFTIVDQNLRYNGGLDESFDGIAEFTGGISLDINNSAGYSKIISEIATKLQQRYVVTVDLAKCGVINTDPCFEINIKGNANATTDEVCFDVCPQPTVVRTTSTIKFDTESVNVNNTEGVKIGVSITDIPEGSDVKSVTAYMKNYNEREYKAYEDFHFEGDGYYVDVPSSLLGQNAVVCYYFRIDMNDGCYLISNPSENIPYGYWTITVSPNTPPHFGDPKVTINGICEESDFCIDVNDKEYNLKYDNVLLYYKEKGLGGEYHSVKMTSNGNQFCASLPGHFSVAPGIEYFFVAEDSYGSLTYKGTNEAPLVEDISYEMPNKSEEESSVVLSSNKYENCSSFLEGDEIFAYFDNGCGGKALGGYCKVQKNAGEIPDFLTIENGMGGSIKNGFANGEQMTILLNRNGETYTISNQSSTYESFGQVYVQLPRTAKISVLGGWTNPIENGSEIVSIGNKTDFGYSKTAITNDYIITNFSGCGEVEILGISTDNPHFSIVEDFKNVVLTNGDRLTFSVQYDGIEDAESHVVITTSAGEYKFKVEAHSTISYLDHCDDVKFTNPLTDQRHTIWFSTEIENGYLRMYVVDQEGKVVCSIYNNYIHKGLHELDLWGVRTLPSDKKYYIVIEREGMGSCAAQVLVK